MSRFVNKGLIVLILVGCLSLTGMACSGDSGKAEGELTTDSGKAEGELTTVSIALDWFPWANHSGLFVAKERGYFKEQGLDVNIYVPGDPSTVLQTVAAGRDDFGISYQPDVLIAREQGIEVVSIMAMVQHPLNSIMTLKDSGINTPKDLKGQKVGSPGVPSDDALIDTMLRNDGLTIQDVEMVNVGYDLVPALLSGSVDAIVGAYWVHESISATNQGFELNIMKMEEHGVPDYYELVIVASDDKIAEEPEIVQKFVNGVTRGYQDAIEDPIDAVALLKRLKPETDLAIENPGVELLAPLWTTDEGIFGSQEDSRWEKFAEWMETTGRLSDANVSRDAYTSQFIEANN